MNCEHCDWKDTEDGGLAAEAEHIRDVHPEIMAELVYKLFGVPEMPWTRPRPTE